MDGTECRKSEHLRICLEKSVEVGDTLLDCVQFVHQPLPEIDYKAIDTSIVFMGKTLRLPLIIAAMTGGCDEASKINQSLAEVAEKKGIGFSLGSQRAMLEKPSLLATYKVRQIAPHALLLGNIGITALKKYSHDQLKDAVRSVDADGLCVHLNPAQEVFQRGGDRDYSGCLAALQGFCDSVDFPVIVKEVGNGISRECAALLASRGVHAIDVGGSGGTNWVYIDSLRSGMDSSLFVNWGIPTAASILECSIGLPIIATGGIRNGLHIAKAIALGADLCGIALPFLRILLREGLSAVERYVDSLMEDVIRTMFLAGCKSVAELRRSRVLLHGPLGEWDRHLKSHPGPSMKTAHYH